VSRFFLSHLSLLYRTVYISRSNAIPDSIGNITTLQSLCAHIYVALSLGGVQSVSPRFCYS
jgi:hypothetical protein